MENNELKPYYVYELRDPSNNEVFYVGKGQGTRAEEHEREAINCEGYGSAKISKIRGIQKQPGNFENNVKIVVVGRYDTEVEALAVEATLIKWVYGFDNLTNLKHGHHHNTIREKDNFEEIAEIDIEKPDYVRDGTFTRTHEALNEKYNVKEKLENLKVTLEGFFPTWEVSDVDLGNPQDPSIYIRYNDDVRIQCMSKSKTDNVIVNILPQQNTKEYREKFALLGVDLGVEVKGGQAPYIKLLGWREDIPKIQDSDAVVKRLQEAWNTLDGVLGR